MECCAEFTSLKRNCPPYKKIRKKEDVYSYHRPSFVKGEPCRENMLAFHVHKNLTSRGGDGVLKERSTGYQSRGDIVW